MHGDGPTHKTPRWVKVFGIYIPIALLLLFGSLHLFGMSLLGDAFSGHSFHAMPSSATEHDLHHP